MARNFVHQFPVGPDVLWTALDASLRGMPQHAKVNQVDPHRRVMLVSTDMTATSWGHHIGLAVAPVPNGSTITMTTNSKFMPSLFDLNKMDAFFADLVKLLTTATATTQAGWYEDPSKQHKFRYYDGFAWTNHVRDAEPATPDIYAVVPAGWHPDPAGRHELRYWDGLRWTDQVSDNGAVSTDTAAPPAG